MVVSVIRSGALVVSPEILFVRFSLTEESIIGAAAVVKKIQRDSPLAFDFRRKIVNGCARVTFIKWAMHKVRGLCCIIAESHFFPTGKATSMYVHEREDGREREGGRERWRKRENAVS